MHSTLSTRVPPGATTWCSTPSDGPAGCWQVTKPRNDSQPQLLPTHRPQVRLLFSIQTDYSPRPRGWGRNGSKQALRRLKRKFETHVCCLGSGNPEPSAHVAQRPPLPQTLTHLGV